MKYIIGLLTTLLIHTSCSVKEAVIDSETGQKIAGYTKDCPLIIGKTTKGEIPERYLNQLKNEGMSLRFAGEPGRGQVGEIVSVGFAGKFTTSRGIKAGDPPNKALSVYGKPKATIVDYGEDHGKHFILYGLFYKNIMFHTDTAFTVIDGIILGKEFDLNKKYIRH